MNCRALRNKVYGIPPFLSHGRHALPGIGTDPLVAIVLLAHFFANENTRHGAEFAVARRSCNEIRARKESDDCNHRAITADYMGPNPTDGFSISRIKAVILPILSRGVETSAASRANSTRGSAFRRDGQAPILRPASCRRLEGEGR